MMRRGFPQFLAVLLFLAVAAAPTAARAQEIPTENPIDESKQPPPPPSSSLPRPISPPVEEAARHSFWDRKNQLLFSGVAVFRALDYASTRNMLARGREEVLIPDDVVNSTAGFPALEAAGTATSIGISYLLHRTGHHKLERWLSIGHIGVTGFGVVRNYSIQTKHVELAPQ